MSAATSILDQAWLSMLNLTLGLILIRLASKDDYGIYTQLYVAGIFAAGIGEALITSPLTTLASTYPEDQRRAMVGHLDRFQGRLSTIVALLFGLGCAAVTNWAQMGQPLWLGLGFAFYVKTNAIREYRRSSLFIEGEAQRVLWIDLRYGIAALACTGLLIWMEWLHIPAVFGMLGVANLVALLGTHAHPVPATDAVPDYRYAVREAWKRGRLGLPGSILAWIINYSYLYLTAAWLGAAATADLNASRLLLMPISLTVLAWSRVARPLIGRRLIERDRRGLRRLLVVSVVGMEVLTLAYIGVLWLAFPLLQQHVLGANYASAQHLVLGWGFYFAVNAARWIGTAALLAVDRYGSTLAVTAVSLTLVLISMNILIPRYGTAGAVMSLTLVETVGLILVWFIYWRSPRKITAL
ncbi:lipopolysaccharide biosynthesis protein [Roseococcus pinisoli]|uniref:Polysaccharide biosynthesis protein n=1 Tax=Roseococcus pinisoli TaxID=2835040 RepID=A0ABS5QFM8_9PROT|nr:hypothetical protein [Roseococcus pinisoli]MBS7811745.1 hypothetical protein [Roseococcus pinisoli]